MFDDGARRWCANGAADFCADCGANICANICKRHWVKRILTRNATHRSIASAYGKYQTQIKDHVFQQRGLIHVRSATSGRARATQSARAD